MRVALALGRRGLGNTWPNPAVGAVIVRDGVVCGRGWTQPGGRPHAETEAIRRAGADARGGTLFATLEPCSHYGKTPPCVDAIIAAGLARVVTAIEDPNPKVAGEGHARLRAAGISVDVGLCAREALRDHSGHIHRVRDGRPHVTLKLAVSADGKVAGAGRTRVAITADAANAYVHLMRARHDAILIGIGTVLADDPLLTCRLPGLEKSSPVRVVLDTDLRLPLSSRLVRTARETPVSVFAGAHAPQERAQALAAEGVDIVRIEENDGTPPALPAVLRELAARGITRLLIEGGPTVATAAVKAAMVDEFVLLRGQAAIGADGIAPFDGLTLDAALAQGGLSERETATLGADRVTIYGSD
ncbi:MAG: bifunctional diaminohydroxyphosphoribosylaminopyrimidine deaminase/5-amino-6-(5-phosphoribosylamino)uracil reductase RibD [Alphaproteobacteria bacterium]|nr:Riboflavin biosynthesis protein RibD [Pseudorhodoplanes sp.]MCQ3942756.1 bifunctional diaminohydroxyphosphoribosylaminopyrimidine deaminase/5-amino-6-(5-phosphoribosylamino)uracil reductase RibD [Alphaproteobacteria bacterium]